MQRVLLLIVLLYSSMLYAQPAGLYNKPYREKALFLDSMERIMVENDNDAKRTARAKQMNTRAAESKDKEFAAMLRLAAIRIRSSITGADTAQIENDLQQLLEEFSDTRYVRMEILHTLGKFYLDVRKRNSMAFEYFLMAYQEYKGLSADDFPQKRSYIYDLAGAYYRYEDHRNAIRYMNEALATSNGNPNDRALTIYNTIGLSYCELKMYDSAMSYLDRAYKTAVNDNNAVWMGILSGNIGEVHYLQNNYPEAIRRLEKSVSLCLANNIRKNAVMATCRLAGIYLSLRDVAAAERCLDRIKPIREAGPFRPGYVVAERFFSVTAKVFAAKGNTSLAYRYADSALMAKDSAHAEQTESNREKAREKADYVQHKLELAKMLSEKERQFVIRNSLIIFIVLVTVIGLLFINRQRLQRKKLVAELDAVTSKLINLTEAETEATEPHTDTALPYREEELDPEAISQLENATLLTNEQWDEFRKLFDKVHKGFLNNLRRKRPDLSPADIRFIALTKLHLSSKEMASMLGVSPGTIRIYKFRLRKKLGLDKEDIEDFINKI